MGNYRPFLQGPLPVANYTRIIIPGRFWTRPPSTKSTRMASSATPLHDSLIELAIPDAHAHAIKWYLKIVKIKILYGELRDWWQVVHRPLVIHRESSLSYLRFMFIVFIIILLTIHKTVACLADVVCYT